MAPSLLNHLDVLAAAIAGLPADAATWLGQGVMAATQRFSTAAAAAVSDPGALTSVNQHQLRR